MSQLSTRQHADLDRILGDFLAAEVARADRLSSVDLMVSRVAARSHPVRRRAGAPTRLAWLGLSLLVMASLVAGAAAVFGPPRFVVPAPAASPSQGQASPETTAASPNAVAARYAGMIAAISQGGSVVAVDPRSGTASELVPCPQGCTPRSSPAWSPDGTQLAYVRTAPSNPGAPDAPADGGVWIRDLGTSGDRQLISCGVPFDCAADTPLAWSPDGTRLALIHDAQLAVATLDGGVTELAPVSPPFPQNISLSWSSDGRSIRYDLGTWQEINVDGTNRHTVPDQPAHPDQPSPDGRRIAYVTDDVGAVPKGQTPQPDPYTAQLWVARADGSEPVLVAESPGCCLGAYAGLPAWSPDGTQLAWIVYRDGIERLITVDADGSNQLTAPLPMGVSRPAWSPVPASVRPSQPSSIPSFAAPASPVPAVSKPPETAPASDDLAGTVTVITSTGISAMDPDTGYLTPLVSCIPACGEFTAAAWSPDGSQLALLGEGEVEIWDLASRTGRISIRCVPGLCPESGSLAWSPDGTALAFFSGGNLVVAPMDGSPVVALTHDASGLPDHVSVLEWTADSRALRYEIDGQRHQIDRDGSHARDLPSVAQGSGTVTAPNGIAMAWVGELERSLAPGIQADPFTAQLWVDYGDGSAPRVVAQLPGCCLGAWVGAPSWSDDGGQLAWTGYNGKDGDRLQIVNVDGSNLRAPTMSVSPSRAVWYPLPSGSTPVTATPTPADTSGLDGSPFGRVHG